MTVSGDALDRAQRIWNEMKDEPDTTGKLEILAEALEKADRAGALPGGIRVVRLLEYLYPDAKDALTDQQNWQVQGVYRPSAGRLIRSTVLPMEVLD
jgi:hypothetical protein